MSWWGSLLQQWGPEMLVAAVVLLLGWIVEGLIIRHERRVEARDNTDSNTKETH